MTVEEGRWEVEPGEKEESTALVLVEWWAGRTGGESGRCGGSGWCGWCSS